MLPKTLTHKIVKSIIILIIEMICDQSDKNVLKLRVKMHF